MINRVKNSKLLLCLAALILGLTIVLVTRISHAYLAMESNIGSADVTITGDKVDQLKFIPGEELSLDVNPENLDDSGDNVSTSSTYQVSLTANNTSNKATYNYYVYLNIPSNDFVYTTEEKTPEILLSVIGPDGEVTNIPGLKYGTTHGVSGFDVTTYKGIIGIALGKEIVSTSSVEATTHDWTITLTYLNLNSNQSENYGSTLVPEIIFQKNAIKNN